MVKIHRSTETSKRAFSPARYPLKESVIKSDFIFSPPHIRGLPVAILQPQFYSVRFSSGDAADTAKTIYAWSAFEDPSVADLGANSPETEGTEDSSAVGGFLGACIVYSNFS